MGIRHLLKVIEKNVSNYKKTISLTQLNGKKVAIDTSIYMYQYLTKNALFDEFYLMIQLFLDAGIIPIFIFDGRPHHHKNKTMQMRREHRNKKEEQLKQLNPSSFKERKRLKKQCLRITQQDTQIVKELLDAMGVMYLDAPYEADELCAKLVLDKSVYACLSDDTDMFVYGCSKILRSLDLFQETVTIYDMSRILRCMKMPQSDFRDMCILSGTDYNDGEHNIEYYYKIYSDYKKSKCQKPFYEWLLHQGRANMPFKFAKISFHFDLRNANYEELKVYDTINIVIQKPHTKIVNKLLLQNGFLLT